MWRDSVKRALMAPSAIVLTCLLAIEGCTQVSVDGMHRAEDIADYAVVPTALGRWDDVSTDLQPNFKLGESDALVAVDPVTSYEDASRSKLSSFQIGIGSSSSLSNGAGSYSSSTQLPLDPATGEPLTHGTATGTQTINYATSQTYTLPQPPIPTPITSSAAISPPTTGESAGIEPQLKYDLATALLQHVKLLNRQIRNAVQEQEMTPFVVTLKLSVQPIRRDLPLDTYFDIAFAQISKDVKSSDPLSLFDVYQATSQMTLRAKTNGIGAGDVRVVPLLNYDSLESQIRTYSQNEIDSAATSLLAAYQQIGVRVDAASLRSELRRTYGRRHNNLLNILSLSPNTVRVRLGAAFSPENDEEAVMSVRENSISFVVFIPNDALLRGASLAIASRPHLRRVDSGRRLGDGGTADSHNHVISELSREIAAFRAPVRITSSDRTKLAETLIVKARLGSLNAFLDALNIPKHRDDTLESDISGDAIKIAKLWLTALGAYDGPATFQQLAMPNTDLRTWPTLVADENIPEPLLIHDDKQIVFTMRNGLRLDNAIKPAVFLIPSLTSERLDGANSAKIEQYPTLQASTVTVSPDGTMLQAIFSRPKREAVAYKVAIDFTPPVPVSQAIWLATQHASAPSFEDRQIVDAIKRKANGKFAFASERVLPLLEGGTANATPQLPRITLDQTVIRITKDPHSSLSLRVSRLPAAYADTKDKDPIYLRIKNARSGLGQGNAVVIASDGGLKLDAVGAQDILIEDVVPAMPVVIETYQLNEKLEERNNIIHAALAVSP